MRTTLGLPNEASSALQMLIVEDDPDTCMVLGEIITSESPFAPVLVATVEAALHVLETCVPVLILLDYHLPDMDGIQFYDLLQHHPLLHLVPVLLISADLPRQQMRQRGLSGISKPFRVSTLLHQIALVLPSLLRVPVHLPQES